MPVMNAAMDGKTCVITGGNAGIGKRAAVQLAVLGAEVIIICRNPEKGQQAVEEIKKASASNKVTCIVGDLSSQESIRDFPREIRNRTDRLDVLIHNAANFDLSMKTPQLTADGVEVIFATNHLGPFLLTNQLLEPLEKSGGRVLTIASKGLLTFPNMTVNFNNLNGERTFSPVRAYYQSKLAQLMFTYRGAELLQPRGITINAIRVPSVKVDYGRHEEVTALMRQAYKIKRKFALSPEKMAETYVYLSASPVMAGVTGSYFDEKNQPVKSSKKSYDREIWTRLWTVSNQLTGIAEW